MSADPAGDGPDQGESTDLTDSPERTAEWLQPPAEDEGLQRYVGTVRERFRLIALITALTTLIAVLYVFTATKMYSAEADLLITPISAEDPTLNSLGLLTSTSDPTRDVETAAKLVTNIDVAGIARRDLNSNETPQELLEKVSAVPVAQSNVIAVTSTDTPPKAAQDLANAFAEAAVQSRTNQLHEQIDLILPGLEKQLEKNPEPAGPETLNAKIAELETLRNASDPTIRVAVSASLPTSPSSPKTTLSIIAGIIAGLVLGIGGAFTAQALDPRLRREEQLRRRYRLPILARIPKEDGRSRAAPLSPRSLSPMTSEAYRTLRATLAAANRTTGRGRVIMVTGSAPSEGKTTTAVNLATAFALSGKRVILIESDLRQPAIGTALGIKSKGKGILGLLTGNSTLRESLVQLDTYGPNLQILLADYDEGWIPELFSIPAAEEMIEQARAIADYVIVDSAPLNEVADALPLARIADDVLMVTRIGKSRLDKISQLGELLVENGIRPTGFVVVAAPKPAGGKSSYYARESRGNGVGGARELSRPKG
jgi:capsular exopolysaccharide synthesis family protein